MFSPKTPHSRYQSLGGSGSGLQSRKRSSIYAPQRKSLASSGKTPGQVPASLQPRVYEENGQYKLESYGQALPILLSEALAVKDRHVDPSVHMANNGWAWLVINRRLIVWMYKIKLPGKSPPCHELTLPPSGQQYKASLVCVIPHTSDGTTAACLAISPEGAIRYWPNLIHESSFTEMSVDVKGEQCADVSLLLNNRCLVSSTCSSLLLVILPSGQMSLQCRVLRAPHGMLKGIRRMSSLFFGSASAQSMGEKFHRMCIGEVLDASTLSFYVLCGSSLQKWAISNEQEKMLYQCNVEQFVVECLSQEVWHEQASQLPQLKTWILDMGITKDGIIVLAAGMNQSVSKNVYYCIGMLHTPGVDSPRSFLSFSVIRHIAQYSVEDEAALLSYRLLLPDPNSAQVFIYHKQTILCSSVTGNQLPVDKFDFYAGGDKILGSGCPGGVAVFFSSNRGLIAVRNVTTQMDVSLAESMNETVSRMETSMAGASSDRLDELSMSDDETQRLKAAFLHFCRGNSSQAQSMVDEMFPPGMPRTDEAGTSLDRLVCKVSQEMIDDFPAADPRWAESQKTPGSAVSLILLHQLDDKLKAHEYYIQFLKSIGLWDRLGNMHVRNTLMQSTLLLCEHAEKLVAARALRELHNQHQTLVDQAISLVLETRGDVLSSGLTATDIFYRQVSRIHEMIDALAEVEERNMAGDIQPRDVVELITTVNTLLGGMLMAAVQYRTSKADIFQSMNRSTEFVAWTASDGSRGIRALLTKQHNLTVSSALPEAHDNQERGRLFQQLLELTGGLLDGYKTQIDTSRLASDVITQHYTELLQRYEQERTRLIAPFVKHQQFERAAMLGEKYQDFTTLVQVCEQTDNQDRLHRYMNQFQAKGFADFVFKWYLDEGKRGKLMSSSLSSHPQLSRFLHSGENKFMSWLHDIGTNNYLHAHKTLFDLGLDEKSSLTKKKTLLSLSKLAALCTEDSAEIVHNNIEAINEEQDLVNHQEQLPSDVLESLGIDSDNMRVYSPKEIIELFIGEYNTDADEYQFRKCLDLLSYIDKADPELPMILSNIWSRAILRDEWGSISPDDHLEGCRDTIFFKTVELLHSQGCDLKEFLPNVDVLLNCELLLQQKDNTNFQFLIKACFEQIHRVLQL